MKKTLIIPAVIGLLAVPSFVLAHNGNSATAKTNSGTNTSLKSDADADDTATIPAVPATPATRTTSAIPATPAVPAVGHDSDDVAGQVETENENDNTVPDNSSYHANVSASTEHSSVSVGAKIDK